MPLALLLHDMVTSLQRGIARLRPWTTMALQEELLLSRARGAFLAAWFGPVLPLRGGSIEIAIANLRALAVRYAEVLVQSGERAGSGRNLTEPLAGVAGALAGAVFAPPVAFALGVGLHTLPGWVRALLIGYGILALGLPILLGFLGLAPAAAAVGGGVIGGAGVLAGAVAGVQHRGAIALLGGLAGLLAAVTEFWRQLTGPRAGVRNPLLRQTLGVLDAMARLVPFLLAATAVVFTRIVPFIADLARHIEPWARLLATYRDLLTALANDLKDEILRPFQPGGLLLGLPERIMRALILVLPRVLAPINRFLADAAAVIGRQAGIVETELTTYLSGVATFLDRSFRPVLDLLATGSDLLAVLTAVDAQFFPSSPAAAGGLPSYPDWLRYVPTAPPPPPPLPAFPAGPPPLVTARLTDSLAATMRLFEAPFVLSPEAQRAVAAIRNPPSVFADEWTRLARRRATIRSPERLLVAKQEAPLRDLIVGLLQRNLPGAVRPYLPRLTDIFRRLDAEILAHPERMAPVAPFPVVTPEEPVLRPEVKRLRIRIRLAATEGETDATDRGPAVRPWAESLRRELAGQTYPVPERGPASGAAAGPTAMPALE